MNRILLATSLVFIFVMSGCSRIENPATARVVFAIDGVQYGKMDTKATVTEFLREIQLHYTPVLTVEGAEYSGEVQVGESVEV